MREPLINKVMIVRLTLLALFVSVVALVIPYPQNRIQVAEPQVDSAHTNEIDSNS